MPKARNRHPLRFVLLVAAIGVATLQVRQRWYAREINDLEYLNERLNNETND